MNRIILYNSLFSLKAEKGRDGGRWDQTKEAIDDIKARSFFSPPQPRRTDERTGLLGRTALEKLLILICHLVSY